MAIRIGNLRLELAATSGNWQEGIIPLTEGDPGQGGAIVLDTAHAGYGDSRGVLAGHYEYAVDIDASVPQLLRPSPLRTDIAVGGTAAVSGAFDVGSYTWLLAGQYVRRLNPADNSLLTVIDAGAGNTVKSGVAWNGKGYVAAGGTLYEITPPSTVASAAIAADVLAVGLSALYKASGAQVSKATANPLVAANWSAPTTFGDPSVPVTWMAEYGRFLFVAKEDGLWALDADFNAVNVLPELAPYRHSDNGRCMQAWHGLLMVPHRQGLYAYSVGEVLPVGPERLETNESPAAGRVVALASAGRWLYAALQAGNDTYVLAGRERDGGAGGPGPMLWHTVWQLPSATCRMLHVSGLTNPPRLYIGRGADVSYVPLLDSTGASRQASGSIYWARLSGRQPRTPKLWTGVDLAVEGSGPVTCYVSVEGRPWEMTGRATGPGAARLDFPADARFVGRWLSLRLELGSANTEVVMPVVVSYITAPRLAKAYMATVTLGGSLGDRDAEERLSRLLEMAQPGAGPVPLVTPYGQEAMVRVVDVRRQAAASPSSAYVVSIAMREVG